MELTHSEGKSKTLATFKVQEKGVLEESALEETIDKNVDSIQAELAWLNDIIVKRIETLLDKGLQHTWQHAPKIAKAPALKTGSYKDFVLAHELSYAERLLLILCFGTAYDPAVLDLLRTADPATRQRYRILGGRISKNEGVFYPTLQTLLFLLAGNDQRMAAKYLYHLRERNKLFTEQVLYLVKKDEDLGYFPAHEVRLDSAYYNYFLFAERPRLDEGEHFPARLLETEKTFDDLILPALTLEHLKPPMDYLRNQQKVFGKEGTHGKIKSGHVMMLYGPPGTGKTLTAAVMGKHLGVDTYAIELSQIVSKYIGETEKNIDKIFERLQDKNCIIFFDEADALFGKRTEIKDAKDKYANQETSHLLQKIEQCNALVILASNYKQNLDDAFKRRILTYVHIPPPDYEERFKMWRKSVPDAYEFEPVDLSERLARDHQLTGANIANVIKLACFDAEAAGTNKLTKERLEHFISKELLKENRKQSSFNNTKQVEPSPPISPEPPTPARRPAPTSINPNPEGRASVHPSPPAPPVAQMKQVAEQPKVKEQGEKAPQEQAEENQPIAVPEGFTPQPVPDPNPVYRPSDKEGFQQGVRVQAMSEAEARRKGLLTDKPKSRSGRKGRGKRF